MVEGSSTYEWVVEKEHILDQPEKWRQFYGDKPTFVFTTRELPVPTGADVRFVSGSVADVPRDPCGPPVRGYLGCRRR